MHTPAEFLHQPRSGSNRALRSDTYTNIIRDDSHLSLLLDMIKGPRYDKILDIGTGNGYLAVALSRRYPKAHIYGIDTTENVMHQNGERARKKGLDNLSFWAYDGLHYPFEKNTFDLIIARLAFHHFPSAADAIRQMSQILVPGGQILIADPILHTCDRDHVIDRFMRVKKDGHNRLYSLEELDEMMGERGFSVSKRIISHMHFPFASRREYGDIYCETPAIYRQLYDMRMENGVVWVGNMDVGNTLYGKKG